MKCNLIWFNTSHSLKTIPVTRAGLCRLSSWFKAVTVWPVITSQNITRCSSACLKCHDAFPVCQHGTPECNTVFDNIRAFPELHDYMSNNDTHLTFDEAKSICAALTLPYSVSCCFPRLLHYSQILYFLLHCIPLTGIVTFQDKQRSYTNKWMIRLR